MRRIPSSYTPAQTKTIAVMGDSLVTGIAVQGVPVRGFWGAVLAESLRGLGYGCKVRQFGVSGTTSLEALVRKASMVNFDVPTIAVLWSGHNDTRSGTVTSGGGTTSGVITAGVMPGKGTNLGWGGTSVGAAISEITWSGGSTAGVTVTNCDATTLTITTASNLPANATAITVQLDTKANLKSLTEYLLGAGCQRVVICSTHFQNFNGGGDNSAGNVPYPAPQAGTRLNLWTAQRDAVTEEAAARPGQAAFCDLYAAMYDVLTNARNPFYVAGKAGVDAFWHIGAANTHLNALGNRIVAAALLATIQQQSEWIGSLLG